MKRKYTNYWSIHRGYLVIKTQRVPATIRVTGIVVLIAMILFVGVVFGTTMANTPSNTSVTTSSPLLNATPNIQSSSDNPTSTSQILERMKAAQRWKPKNFSAEVECLAQNIYFEAKNQRRRGQIAVGLVTINRVLSNKYPDTICGVVWQKRRSSKTGREVAQFSWTLDGKTDKPHNKKVWERIHILAQAMLAGQSLLNFQDFTKGATHYHAVYVHPYWQKSLTRVIRIEDHIFYRDEKATPIDSVASKQLAGL